MTLKLIIRKKSDPSFLQDLDLSSFPLFLGREEDSDVTLTDPFRLISRKHAQIVNTEGILQLIDLGSANFTYLNEQKLEPKEENPIKTGDRIRIGEYELDVQLVNTREQPPTSADDDNRTIIFSSPYNEEISQIAENLSKIAQKYSLDDSPMKAEALKFSLGQTFNGLGINDIKKIFGDAFAADNNFKENFYTPEKAVYSSYGNDLFHDPELQKAPSISKKMHSENLSDTPMDYPFGMNFTNILDSLLDMFSKLTQGLLQFKQEFFGVTVYHLMPVDSIQDLKEYLFNPATSPDEEVKRVNLLKDETQKLLIHQVSLLEGYKISVTEGSKLLLQSLDPETAGEEGRQGKTKESPSSGGFLSSLNKSKRLKLIIANYRKYISDPYYLEKKFFRPSFIKGYQKRNSGKSSGDF